MGKIITKLINGKGQEKEVNEDKVVKNVCNEMTE
jgi:hypothetical protein